MKKTYICKAEISVKVEAEDESDAEQIAGLEMDIGDIDFCAEELSENNDIEINITWCTEDVLHTANEMDVSLSKKEANEILKMVERYHDAEYGVSWLTIRCTIAEYDDFRHNAKIQSDEELIWNRFA